MNNNNNIYFTKNGKYSPKMSEKRRIELKESANGSGKSLVKKLNISLSSSDIWEKVRKAWATIDSQALHNSLIIN